MTPGQLRTVPIAGFNEPISALTHLVGAGVFAVLGAMLLRRAHGHWGRTAALAIFALGSVLLLGISGVYHMLSREGAPHVVFERLDHAAIFFVIAGTLTAVQSLLFTGVWRWGTLALLWTITISAITLKTIFFDSVSEGLGLAMYFALGWIGAASVWRIYRRRGFAYIRPLIWGGLAYTGGATLEFLRQPVLIPGVLGPHEVFHVAVLAGLGWHWRFISAIAHERARAH